MCTPGARTVIHPKARIIAEAGPVIIGEYNIIEELVHITNKWDTFAYVWPKIPVCEVWQLIVKYGGWYTDWEVWWLNVRCGDQMWDVVTEWEVWWPKGRCGDWMGGVVTEWEVC